ncbi:MAG: hypothetical protein A2V99_00665 [Spirochaetes bacterium RBG_16_67_19]|nr:MAG: hypothetical protein A2V99_00665 [Spirochaetes bacterium RBG_16_67_19]
MARGQFSSADAAFSTLWGAGGLADYVEGDGRLSADQKLQMTAYKAAAQANNYVGGRANNYLVSMLRKVLSGKQV